MFSKDGLRTVLFGPAAVVGPRAIERNFAVNIGPTLNLARSHFCHENRHIRQSRGVNAQTVVVRDGVIVGIVKQPLHQRTRLRVVEHCEPFEQIVVQWHIVHGL